MINCTLFEEDNHTIMGGTEQELLIEIAEIIVTYMMMTSSAAREDDVIKLALALDDDPSNKNLDALHDVVSTCLVAITNKVLSLLYDREYLEAKNSNGSTVNVSYDDTVFKALKAVLTDIKKDKEKDD